MDSGLQYLVLAEESLYDCIRSEKEGDWELVADTH